MTHTVLLVDDDMDVLHCLARILQKQPYKLYTARTGEEAVCVLKSHRVDVIVADERMPGMSGVDLLVWIARNYPETVTIMLTGNPSMEMLVRAINEAGVYHFFTKPCNHAHLAVTIRKALEHKDLVNKHAALLEVSREQTQQRERFVGDLEALDHMVSRDLKKPLCAIGQSCQTLIERHQDSFDPKVMAVLKDALEALADMQILLGEIRGRVGSAQQSAECVAQESDER